MLGKVVALWANVHPKIKTVALVALLTAAVTILNAFADIYSAESWQPVLVAVIATVGGWLTSAKEAAKAKK